MQTFSTTSSQPLSLSPSVESQTYALFAIAMALTFVGVLAGFTWAPLLLTSGVLLVCVILELAIIFTARFWMDQSPLNYLLFGLFPILSGFTITPYLLAVLSQYVNGASILLNAALATTCMGLAAAVFARTTRWNLSVFGRALFFSILGLLILGLLQVFVPSLRTGTAELLISGAGMVVFALFTAFDLQRIQHLGQRGVSPFLLAISLYLDIFNLFLYVLRFMTAFSGNRR